MSLSSQDSASKSPIEFKEALLSTLNHGAKLFQLLYCVEPLSDIVLLEHQDIEYDLKVDFGPLDHPETMALDEERSYLQLKYAPGKELPEGVTPKYPCQAVESFRSTLPKHPASAKLNGGDFFLPIGWFVENRGMEYSHLTRYVCMLNVSTQPVSMWAVYDYRAYNNEDDTFTDLDNLTRIYMEDVLDWNLTQNPVTGVRAVMDGKDLVLLYEDIKDWHPDGATVWNKPGKEKYLLGKSVRAHANVLPPKELLDAITVKDGKQEPETCKDNAVGIAAALC